MMNAMSGLAALPRARWTVAAVTLLSFALIGASLRSATPRTDPPAASAPRVPQDKAAAMKGHTTCAECHGKQVETWKASKHFKSFTVIPRHADVRAILEKIDPGVKDMQASARCATCHFTRAESAGKVTWGPTCESCHAPKGDHGWFEKHNLFLSAEGAKVKVAADEGPEMKKKRLQALDKMGMIRSGQIYNITKNCLDCHAVPDEGLVNGSKHINGLGKPFELVSFSQGHVKHNFKNGGTENVALDGASLRKWYVVGQLAVLDHALRALAAAKKGKYGDARVSQIRTVSDNLADILDAAESLKEIEGVLDAIPRRPKAGNADLIATADMAKKVAEKLETSDVFKELKSLDELIPMERN